MRMLFDERVGNTVHRLYHECDDLDCGLLTVHNRYLRFEMMNVIGLSAKGLTTGLSTDGVVVMSDSPVPKRLEISWCADGLGFELRGIIYTQSADGKEWEKKSSSSMKTTKKLSISTVELRHMLRTLWENWALPQFDADR